MLGTKNYKWAPKEDITPYELAKALDVLLIAASARGLSVNLEELVENLPEGARRHFEEIHE